VRKKCHMRSNSTKFWQFNFSCKKKCDGFSSHSSIYWLSDTWYIHGDTQCWLLHQGSDNTLPQTDTCSSEII
jgi:hypothetical protein